MIAPLLAPSDTLWFALAAAALTATLPPVVQALAMVADVYFPFVNDMLKVDTATHDSSTR